MSPRKILGNLIKSDPPPPVNITGLSMSAHHGPLATIGGPPINTRRLGQSLNIKLG